VTKILVRFFQARQKMVNFVNLAPINRIFDYNLEAYQ